MFAVEQSLRQAWVLAPFLFNIFFAAVINVAYMHFKAYEYVIYALVHLRNKTRESRRGGGGNQRSASRGDVALGHA